MKNDVIVIGGGAAGMVAAICAARNGANVTIIEQNNMLGKKILATGNGRCNYTNKVLNTTHFFGEDIAKLSSFFTDYSPKKIIEFFETLGINPKYRGDYVYPQNDQAMSIALALQLELFSLNVKQNTEEEVYNIIFNCKPKNKDDHSSKIKIITNKDTYYTMNCILATGGNSGLPSKIKMKGYDLIKDTRHSLTPLSPALTGLQCKEPFFKRVSGVREEAKVSLYLDTIYQGHDLGEVQLTDYGISGIPVFQLSRIAGIGLKQNKTVSIVVDFAPQYSQEEYLKFLWNRKKHLQDKNFKSFLNGLFKEKLGLLLMEQSGFTLSTQVCDITKEELNRFAACIKMFKLTVVGINDYNKAQVTAGGVPLAEIDENFQSTLHKGLYLTGEVLDVDGICGGYNLHFAWASGMKVGNSIFPS